MFYNYKCQFPFKSRPYFGILPRWNSNLGAKDTQRALSSALCSAIKYDPRESFFSPLSRELKRFLFRRRFRFKGRAVKKVSDDRSVGRSILFLDEAEKVFDVHLGRTIFGTVFGLTFFALPFMPLAANSKLLDRPAP